MKRFLPWFLTSCFITALATYLLGAIGLGNNGWIILFIIIVLVASVFMLIPTSYFPFRPWEPYPRYDDTAGTQMATKSDDLASEFGPRYKEYANALRKEKAREKKRNYLGVFILLLTIIITVIYVLTVLIYNFKSTKEGIVGGAFLLSLGLSIIYYVKHPVQFSSTLEKIGFFSGTALGPPTVIQFLF